MAAQATVTAPLPSSPDTYLTGYPEGAETWSPIPQARPTNSSASKTEVSKEPMDDRSVPTFGLQTPASDQEDDLYDDAWARSWDQQPDSGPLIVPTVVEPNRNPHASSLAMNVRAGDSESSLREGPTTQTSIIVPSPSKSAPPDIPAGLPPVYSPPAGGTTLGRSLSDTSETSLPPYEVATAASSTSPKTAPGFHPTRTFQIETQGIGMLRIPILPPRSLPVPIRTVSSTGTIGPAIYSSIQASRTSGSCILVDAENDVPVCMTLYAPGPVRPPKLHLILNSTDQVVTAREAATVLKVKPPYDAEIVPVTGDAATSRACSIRTSLGHFRWRYGNREEKAEASGPIMIFERIRETTMTGGKKQETRKRVGQLLRNEEHRSEGSSTLAAGNGGRVMLDLNEWADRDGESHMLEILAISSCLVMLRKEMNQRRLRQAAVLATTAAII